MRKCNFQHVLKSAKVCLLEPVMRLSIHAEPDVVSKVTQDIYRKRGYLEQVEGSRTQLVELVGHAPLSELKGYSTYLRTMTSGRAFLGLELSHYQLMAEDEMRLAIEDVTGFKPT